VLKGIVFLITRPILFLFFRIYKGYILPPRLEEPDLLEDLDPELRLDEDDLDIPDDLLLDLLGLL